MSKRLRRKKLPRRVRPGDTVYFIVDITGLFSKGDSIVVTDICRLEISEEDVTYYIHADKFLNCGIGFQINQFSKRPNGPPLTLKDVHVTIREDIQDILDQYAEREQERHRRMFELLA